jgi:preprotein translocase subunit SecG
MAETEANVGFAAFVWFLLGVISVVIRTEVDDDDDTSDTDAEKAFQILPMVFFGISFFVCCGGCCAGSGRASRHIPHEAGNDGRSKRERQREERTRKLELEWYMSGRKTRPGGKRRGGAGAVEAVEADAGNGYRGYVALGSVMALVFWGAVYTWTVTLFRMSDGKKNTLQIVSASLFGLLLVLGIVLWCCVSRQRKRTLAKAVFAADPADETAEQDPSEIEELVPVP